VAEIDVAAGELASARAHLLEADAVAAVLDEVSYRSTVQAQLADVEARLGDPAAARVAIEFSEQLTAPEDVINYAITHSVRARLALADGHPEAAERWARSAVRHAFVTDQPQTRADAELELARILA